MTTSLDLSPDELLTTTRAVRRRLDFDRAVDLEVIRACLHIALQAPSGSNTRGWHWSRISLWILTEDGWRVYFHQGTPATH